MNTERSEVHVVPLAGAPGERDSWGRPVVVVYLWSLIELLLVTNPLQVSSRARIFALRRFGAKIGEGVIFRPRTRVKFPWKLEIGMDSWIGEGVWLHNQDRIVIGSNVVISQESFITTGSHAHRTDMSLVTSPVMIDDGVWLTSRTVVTGGVHIGRSALVKPVSLVQSDVPANAIFGGNPGRVVGERFVEDLSPKDKL